LGKTQREKADLADIKINIFEPFSEGWITAAIINEDVDSIEDDAHGGVIGEALQKSAQLLDSKFELRVLRKQ
jgi:hypothetical protein